MTRYLSVIYWIPFVWVSNTSISRWNSFGCFFRLHKVLWHVDGRPIKNFVTGWLNPFANALCYLCYRTKYPPSHSPPIFQANIIKYCKLSKLSGFFSRWQLPPVIIRQQFVPSFAVCHSIFFHIWNVRQVDKYKLHL